ncbi:TetR/AcrR family transcriptional regulator [Cellulomonas sp. SLBN-39]|uniref:TetR/AcrR family transcriptional regulator n=1 Tax=Cellulomonas sp. SLBN-39 TaxID=2768446 RepID=UPI00114FE3C2|nr:TetR/AcrR family transcriptional regulator [Cellulomonas sp. SLBN-39]TQL03962.1 TetR family transcriptional regulator [Cellulomonas sp. SLBN-39]
MSVTSRPPGRRERNKQDKLDRIVAAARDLFAERGVDDVTTQEIAERADIGAGTLFLYARNKGELLLLVQNAAYAQSLERGARDAARTDDALDAVLAVVRPVVECNRAQVENGRTYLREMVFGDPEEPHHREALTIAGRTEEAIADVLRRPGVGRSDDAEVLARVVSSVMFLAMAASADGSVDDVVDEVRRQLTAVLRPGGR